MRLRRVAMDSNRAHVADRRSRTIPCASSGSACPGLLRAAARVHDGRRDCLPAVDGAPPRAGRSAARAGPVCACRRPGRRPPLCARSRLRPRVRPPLQEASDWRRERRNLMDRSTSRACACPSFLVAPPHRPADCRAAAVLSFAPCRRLCNGAHGRVHARGQMVLLPVLLPSPPTDARSWSSSASRTCASKKTWWSASRCLSLPSRRCAVPHARAQSTGLAVIKGLAVRLRTHSRARTCACTHTGKTKEKFGRGLRARYPCLSAARLPALCPLALSRTRLGRLPRPCYPAFPTLCPLPSLPGTIFSRTHTHWRTHAHVQKNKTGKGTRGHIHKAKHQRDGRQREDPLYPDSTMVPELLKTKP